MIRIIYRTPWLISISQGGGWGGVAVLLFLIPGVTNKGHQVFLFSFVLHSGPISQSRKGGLRGKLHHTITYTLPEMDLVPRHFCLG